jgi:DNA-binding response OmpR family regulator
VAAQSPGSTILVYSHRRDVRDQITGAIGRRPAPDLGRVSFLEVAEVADVIYYADHGEAHVAVLDGEAQPTGGIGLCRQLKAELAAPPPIVLVVRRNDDKWLATWARADAVLVHPLDPLTAAETVAEVLRAGRLPGVRG